MACGATRLEADLQSLSIVEMLMNVCCQRMLAFSRRELQKWSTAEIVTRLLSPLAGDAAVNEKARVRHMRERTSHGSDSFLVMDVRTTHVVLVRGLEGVMRGYAHLLGMGSTAVSSAAVVPHAYGSSEKDQRHQLVYHLANSGVLLGERARMSHDVVPCSFLLLPNDLLFISSTNLYALSLLLSWRPLVSHYLIATVLQCSMLLIKWLHTFLQTCPHSTIYTHNRVCSLRDIPPSGDNGLFYHRLLRVYVEEGSSLLMRVLDMLDAVHEASNECVSSVDNVESSESDRMLRITYVAARNVLRHLSPYLYRLPPAGAHGPLINIQEFFSASAADGHLPTWAKRHLYMSRDALLSSPHSTFTSLYTLLHRHLALLLANEIVPDVDGSATDGVLHEMPLLGVQLEASSELLPVVQALLSATDLREDERELVELFLHRAAAARVTS